MRASVELPLDEYFRELRQIDSCRYVQVFADFCPPLHSVFLSASGWEPSVPGAADARGEPTVRYASERTNVRFATFR